MTVVNAETILVNGRVLTMDSARPRAEALAIAGGHLLAVGDGDAVRALAGPGTAVIDAGGATVLPGFVESHMHLFSGGAELGDLHLEDCATAEALAPRLRAYAAGNPGRRPLVAQAAGYRFFTDAEPRAVLDRILPDRPVALVSDCHHIIWVNTAALEAAGILRGRALPSGNEIVMGPDGLSTGELREPEAYRPVMLLGGVQRYKLGLQTGRDPEPAPDPAGRAEDLDHIRRGLAHAARHGITSIVNMDGIPYLLELLTELRDAGELTARVRVPFHFVPDMTLADLNVATAMHRRWNDDWLASGFVKLFMDGVIDSGTAFLLNDYADRPGWRGEARFAQDRFAEIACEADSRGLQIAVHAIGDGAVRRVIDGYEAARRANGRADMRHRIEHLELVDPADIPRLAHLGLIASMQPPHPPGAMGFPLQPTLGRIGRARWDRAYAWRRIAAAGTAMAFASDWPVSDISVLRGTQAATTRKTWADDLPDQSLTLPEALAGYTIGGAYAEHSEGRKGSLVPGKLADLVILDGDIEAVPAEEIGRLNVIRTIVGGRTVFEA